MDLNKTSLSLSHKILFKFIKLRIAISILFLFIPIGIGWYLNWNMENYYYSYSIWGFICAAFNFVISSSQNLLMQQYKNVWEMVQKYDSSYLLEARDYSRRITHKSSQISDDELIQQINDNEELRRSVIYLFNFWEVLYGLIKVDMVSASFAKSYFITPFKSNLKVYSAWLDKVKKEADPKGYAAIYSLKKLWENDN